MQKFKIQFSYAVLFVAVLFLSACGDNATTSDAADTEETTEEATADTEEATTETAAPEEMAAKEEGPEITSAYVCPMHCEGSGSDKEGKCPKCEMDYVFNAPYHSAYTCPMHCKDSGSDKEGKCPTCGMDYVQNEHAGHSHG